MFKAPVSSQIVLIYLDLNFTITQKLNLHPGLWVTCLGSQVNKDD